MTVTKASLEALRSRLAKPELKLQLTPGGVLEQQVHTEHYKAQAKQLREGETLMREMSEKLRNDLEKVRNEGVLRAQFNALSHTSECNLRL